MLRYLLLALGYVVHLKGDPAKSKWMERIQSYQLTHINTSEFQPSNIISFNAFDLQFTIILEPNHNLITDQLKISNFKNGTLTSTQHPKSSISPCHYFGKVQEFPQSKVSLSICKNRGVRGQINIPQLQEIFVIAPSKFHLDREYDSKYPHNITDEHIIYKHSDVNHHGIHGCGKDHLDHSHWHHIKFGEHAHHHNRRLLTSDLTVEVLVVLDPPRVDYFKGLYPNGDWQEQAQASTMDIMHHVSSVYYETNWGNDVGTIQVIVSSIVYWEDWSGPLAFYEPCDDEGCYYDYLNQFRNWYHFTGNTDSIYDNGVLISHYNTGDVDGFVGLAGVGVMCSNTAYVQSTNLNSGYPDFSDELLSKIVAHEIGHNFNMDHDDDNCGDGYLLAPYLSAYNDGFSQCSISYLQDMHNEGSSWGDTDCLTNSATSPYDPAIVPVCGNNVVETGETCDSSTDVCCDSDTCQLYTNCCDGEFATECYEVAGFDAASTIFHTVDDVYAWNGCYNGKSSWRQTVANESAAFYIYWDTEWTEWILAHDNTDLVAYCTQQDLNDCYWAVNDDGDYQWTWSDTSTVTAKSNCDPPSNPPTMVPTNSPTSLPTNAPTESTITNAPAEAATNTPTRSPTTASPTSSNMLDIIECSTENVCIDNGELNTFLNGVYKYYMCDGTYTKYKIAGDHEIYLHWKAGEDLNRWEITSHPDLDIGYAYCQKESLSSCIGGQWLVEYHQSDLELYSIDPDMTIKDCQTQHTDDCHMLTTSIVGLLSVLLIFLQ